MKVVVAPFHMRWTETMLKDKKVSAILWGIVAYE